MIRRVSREKLDVSKYDACIESSLQSRIYAFSWYLDIVADNWEVLVLNDYEAVMPISWRKKYGIKYVYPPKRVLELGVFSTKIIDQNAFLIELFGAFKYVDLRMNCNNSFTNFKPYRLEKQQHFLDIQPDDDIKKFYRRDRRKDLKRAEKFGLTEKRNDNSENLIELFRRNVGARFKELNQKDYDILQQIINACIERKVGEVLSVYDENNQIVASGFFIRFKREVTILFSSTNFNNRKNGANTFLIHRAICNYKNLIDRFYFGGSSVPSIAKYFLSFGAKVDSYDHLHYNNLPKLLKFFKK